MNTKIVSFFILIMAFFSVNLATAQSTGTLYFVATAGCTWAAYSDASWITIDKPTGSGSSTITYTLADNYGAVARSATITVKSGTATQTFPISQQPVPPVYPSGGEVLYIQASCAWTAKSTVPWVTITSQTGSPSTGLVYYTVQPNTTSVSRTGTITVTGTSGVPAVFSITQIAPVPMAPAAIMGALYAKADPTCAATIAVTGAPTWLTYTTTRIGNDITVIYTLAENYGPARTATIMVGTVPFIIKQDGLPCDTGILANATPIAAIASSQIFRASSNCPIPAPASSVPWITNIVPDPGGMAFAYQYQVQANTGGTRIGVITVGNKTITVTQQGVLNAIKINQNVNVTGQVKAGSYWTMAGARWPDYVFENKYNLKPLPQVEQYIQANNHLENIPSAKKVAKNGFELANMTINLLEKVEELTLYLIDIDKTSQVQDKKLAYYQEENAKLKKQY